MTTAPSISPETILQMQQDVKTMTCKEMAEKFGTTSQAMRSRLNRLGIEAQRIRNKWTERLDELKALAARMTPQELAEHFGTSTDYVYVLLSRLKIKAAASPRPVQFKGGLEAMRQAAPSMTVAELAAHLEAAPRAVRSNLKRLDLECKSVERAPKKPKVKRVAPKKPAPRAKPRPKQAAKPAPKQAPAPVPQRAAAPSPTIKREVRIITPANVKRTIVPFCPPKDARICNGSSNQPYKPHARTVSVRYGY